MARFLEFLILFQSTLPARGETINPSCITVIFGISIHSPRKGRDFFVKFQTGNPNYFNPLSPQGERPSSYISKIISDVFQSTLPARGETGIMQNFLKYCLFQSTLPARGETSNLFPVRYIPIISIHSPRKGRDQGYSSRLR